MGSGAGARMTGDHASPPRRIAVIGTSGSGKSTLARQIAATIGAPHVELDALFHQPGWVPAERDVFRAEVLGALAGPAWVTDGNYSGFVRDIIWPAADAIVWLDYPFRVVSWRLFLRTVRRGVKREVLWNGNREPLRENFFSRGSLFLWAKNTHWKHRRDWPVALASPEMAHVRIVRLRHPREADAWLRALAYGGVSMVEDSCGESARSSDAHDCTM
jgi:adenylate kinase family enzyme